MEKLELNSLKTQIELMHDIIQNDKSIIYHINEKANEVLKLIALAKYEEENKTYTIKQEDFEQIKHILYILKDKDKFEQLGVLAKSAVPDNYTKSKILELLTK